MYWLPVIFMCVGASDCMIGSGEAKMKERDCQRELVEIAAKVEELGPPPVFKLGCVPVKLPTL